MILDVRRLEPSALDEAARQLDDLRYVELEGLDQHVVPAFRAVLARTLGIDDAALSDLLVPEPAGQAFPIETRRKLSKIATPDDLAEDLLRHLGPLVSRLIGPLVHVSRDFHSQFKIAAIPGIDHYHNETAADYLEVHGAYLLHQDFTGASLPTSPCGLTLWTALNDCDEAPVRIFPRSHRLGLLCNRMWKLGDPRAARFEAPIDFRARVGRGILFNALLVHGTGPSGCRRRVSCDLRFFPFSGFLGTRVHRLAADPQAELERRLADETLAFLQTPLLETARMLGRRDGAAIREPYSPLAWIEYLDARLEGADDRARHALEALVNEDISGEPRSAFCRAWSGRKIDHDWLRRHRAELAGS